MSRGWYTPAWAFRYRFIYYNILWREKTGNRITAIFGKRGQPHHCDTKWQATWISTKGSDIRTQPRERWVQRTHGIFLWINPSCCLVVPYYTRASQRLSTVNRQKTAQTPPLRRSADISWPAERRGARTAKLVNCFKLPDLVLRGIYIEDSRWK